ncbi:MAG: alpha/beta fold hydrolase [Chloroflexi bacterium]|nr:MAG: alpha/beta fold hydrolase [Chloroflexota bacterium]
MRYMVTAWENFVCHKPSLDQAFWCHVVLQDGPQTGGQLKGSFRLLDENGTVIAQIGSGVMKGLNKEREETLRNYLEASEKAKERKNDSQIIRALRGLNQDQWKEYLYDYLQRVFAAILSVEVNDLLIDDALLDMGMDSIVGMEAKIRLEEELAILLPIELLIAGPSIRELTESILPLLALKPSQKELDITDTPLPAYKMDIHSWIIHRTSNPQGKVKLFCFPYGGTRGAVLYRGWQAMLPDYIEVCPIQLPGKGNRLKEKGFTDIEIATEVLKEIILPELDRPYAFYGHSIGALQAYRLAYKLWSEIDNKPGHLFVGAYSAPTILPNPVVSSAREKFKERGYHEIPDLESLPSIMPEAKEEIFAVLHSIVSESQELQAFWHESQELQQYFLRSGLTELQMVRDYNRVETLHFDVPITAIHGKKDDKVTASEMQAWLELTQGPFTFHALPGGHLFLHEDQDQKQLLKIISRDLEKYTSMIEF